MIRYDISLIIRVYGTIIISGPLKIHCYKMNLLFSMDLRRVQDYNDCVRTNFNGIEIFFQSPIIVFWSLNLHTFLQAPITFSFAGV